MTTVREALQRLFRRPEPVEMAGLDRAGYSYRVFWMKQARGTHTFSVISGWLLMETVAIPAFSISRWSSPTDRMQRGQTGKRKAASTPSAFILAAILGAVCLRRGLKLGT